MFLILQHDKTVDNQQFIDNITMDALHRRSQDFQRVGAPGADPRFLVGGRWRAEGPERGAVGAKRRSAEGVRYREGRRSPSPVWGPGGIAPVNF